MKRTDQLSKPKQTKYIEMIIKNPDSILRIWNQLEIEMLMHASSLILSLNISRDSLVGNAFACYAYGYIVARTRA